MDVDARVMSEYEFLTEYDIQNPEATLKQVRDAYKEYFKTHGKQASDTCLLGGRT